MRNAGDPTTGLSYSICIPTFKRNAWLRELLDALARQLSATQGGMFEVVIADNNPEYEAEKLCAEYSGFPCPIVYVKSAPGNLSLARNAAVAASTKDFIVFVDDDQLVSEDFVVTLLKSWPAFAPRFSGGKFQVLNAFEDGIPEWLRSERIFRRSNFDDGVPIPDGWVGTCGIVLNRRIFESFDVPFDPEIPGSEDTDFFVRAGREGHHLCGLSSVKVYERVPPERANLGWILSRALQEGSAAGRAWRVGYRNPKGVVAAQWVAQLAVSFGAVLASMTRDEEQFIVALKRLLRQFGKVAGLFGLRFYKVYGNADVFLKEQQLRQEAQEQRQA